MDAPVEKLGAPAEPLGPSGAPGAGSAVHPGQSRRAVAESDMATGFDRRHPRGVILIRLLATVWLLALTCTLLAYSYWGWALLTLAGAVVNFGLAYRIYRGTKS